jgi:lysophospholipid hydrolase
VEDKMASSWATMKPYVGGLSGWHLLWDRYCPFPNLRYGTKAPKYQELINALSWMSHSQNLRRILEDHVVDLYLRPPHIGSYRLMDFHLMDRMVQDSFRYPLAALEYHVIEGR